MCVSGYGIFEVESTYCAKVPRFRQTPNCRKVINRRRRRSLDGKRSAVAQTNKCERPTGHVTVIGCVVDHLKNWTKNIQSKITLSMSHWRENSDIELLKSVTLTIKMTLTTDYQKVVSTLTSQCHFWIDNIHDNIVRVSWLWHWH